MKKILVLNIQDLTKHKTNLQKIFLAEYLKVFKYTFKILKQKKPTSSTELHHLTYNEIREFSFLPSDIIQEARKDVWATRKKIKKIKSATPRLNNRWFRYNTTKRQTPVFKITYEPRKYFSLPIKKDRAFQRFESFLKNEWKPKNILLKENQLFVCVEKEFSTPEKNKQNIIGIDINSKNFVTVTVLDTVTNKILKQYYFGKDVAVRQRKYEKRRAILKSNADKGSEKAKRYYILNFFEDRIKNLSEYAEEPEYVDTYYDDEELTKNEIQDLLPAVEFKNFSKETLELEPSVISKFYIDYLSFGDLIPDDIPKTINKLSSTYKSLDTTAKLAFIEPISILIANQDKDVELFRLMGPSNPYLELSDSEINYCTLYRCRMLHCNCNEISFEYEDIDNAEKEDWFQKPNEEYATCDYCNKKLELPSDCVRIPLVGGGWQGRFCNDSVNENDEYVPFLCALSWLNEREKNIEKKIDLNKRRMIKIVSSKLEEYGLQRQTD